MSWFATAPSNIALIKYMGKKDSHTNLPMNASLSYTLPHLISRVELEKHNGNADQWEPLFVTDSTDFVLSTAAIERFLTHFARLKTWANYTGTFTVRSYNNFPHGSGLASSASSFAALTRCAFMALSELTGQALPSLETQAQWSRLGSGSSCRSFFSPWAIWEEDRVRPIELPYSSLHHQVILISRTEKKVSSSEAHRRITTSPLFSERKTRATENLQALLAAFHAQDWKSAYDVCWAEFQDLHALFATSHTPFSYITNESQALLQHLQTFWRENGDGPLVTMDAGPNIHLLYRPDQVALAQQFQQQYLTGHYDVL